MTARRPMPTTVPQLIEELEQRIAELNESEAAQTPAELRRWVVMTQFGFPLAFDIVRNVADNPRATTIELATRFDERNAHRIARRVEDGKGNQAKAVMLRDAYAWMREETRRLVADLRRPSRPETTTAR